MPSRELIDISILKEFIPPGKKNRPGDSINLTSITIHNTDNSNNGAGAKAHSKFVRETGYYVLNGKKNWVSWHFSVDDSYIIQHLPLSELAYHAGSAANGSSLAIEICMNSDGNQDRANRNAAALAANLLSNFGWSVDKLKKHKDWTGKDCPSQLLTPSKWNSFKKLVQEELDSGRNSLNIDKTEVASAMIPRAAPNDVPDYEIDHHEILRVMDNRDHANIKKPEESLQLVLSALGQSGQTAWPKLFPGGITYLELKVDTSGFHVVVKGPESSEESAETFEGDSEQNDTVPDDGFEADALRIVPPVNSFLSDSESVYGTHTPAHRYGVAKTIQAINKIAEAFYIEFGIRVGIGDISKLGGGKLPGHASHRKGVDVDVRVPRNDAQESASNYKHSSYSRARTQKLVNLFRQNGIIPVTHIFFNDPQVSGVSQWPNHDNHLHVRFDINSAGSVTS